jgi:integrase/recombinase XerD
MPHSPIFVITPNNIESIVSRVINWKIIRDNYEGMIEYAVALKLKITEPEAFKEVLALHIDSNKKKKATYLFESSWKKGYSVRGIRKTVTQYSKLAGMSRSLSPHKLRHFLFTWMKKQGIDDALIQPYLGHQTRQSLEVYSKLSITEAQKECDKVIKHFPI